MEQPKPTPTFTVSQDLGIKVLRAINADKNMIGHAISVGTTPGVVWLNGNVKTKQQRNLAENLARKAAPKAAINNRLVVGESTKTP